jgi:hypothetical protein
MTWIQRIWRLPTSSRSGKYCASQTTLNEWGLIHRPLALVPRHRQVPSHGLQLYTASLCLWSAIPWRLNHFFFLQREQLLRMADEGDTRSFCSFPFEVNAVLATQISFR